MRRRNRVIYSTDRLEEILQEREGLLYSSGSELIRTIIERYDTLMRHYESCLTQEEFDLVFEVLREKVAVHKNIDSLADEFLSALPEKNVSLPAGFVDKLRSLGFVETLAIMDKMERRLNSAPQSLAGMLNAQDKS